MLYANETFFTLDNIHNFTERDISIIDFISPLEHQIQKQELKDSGWRLVKFCSLTLYFSKTIELNG